MLRFAELDVLGAVAPRVRAALSRAWDAAHEAIEPELLGLVRRRVEGQLGLVPNVGEEPSDPLSRAIAALSDQFVFYVPDVTEDLRAPVREALGADGLQTLVEALYVVDQTARLRLVHARLFGEGGDPAAVKAGEPASLDRSLAGLHAEAMRLDELDPVTTEVVRLRAGNYHDCKT